MLIIVGLIIVVVCVLGGYMAMGGYLSVLWQPFEFVIIGGALLGAYIIANTKTILGKTMPGMKIMLRGPQYDKQSYLDLLGMLYILFKVAKTKGMLALEAHIETPEESSIFSQFPKFLADHHGRDFLCDYFRLLTMGVENPYHMDDLLTEDLEVLHYEEHSVVGAMQSVADGAPAIGIVAAVLGVIKTMGAITEPPEILGKLIGGALVGTFLGVFMAYGMFGPMASALKNIYDADARYFSCMKIAILAYLNGYAPTIAVEFARKSLPSDVRPEFIQLEEYLEQLPDPQ